MGEDEKKQTKTDQITGSCEVELKSSEHFRMERKKKKHIAILVVNLPTAPLKEIIIIFLARFLLTDFWSNKLEFHSAGRLGLQMKISEELKHPQGDDSLQK